MQIFTDLIVNVWKFLVYIAKKKTAATSKMERFVMKANGWKPITVITKRSILEVAAVLDPSLAGVKESSHQMKNV